MRAMGGTIRRYLARSSSQQMTPSQQHDEQLIEPPTPPFIPTRNDNHDIFPASDVVPPFLEQHLTSLDTKSSPETTVLDPAAEKDVALLSAQYELAQQAQKEF